MRDLNYELKQLCRRNRDGSYATQRDRERALEQIAKQLHEMGFRHMAAASLKPRHVERLVERWKAEGLAVGTIKNRMAELRWWAEKIGKQNVIAKDNDHYGIGNRRYVTHISKARELTVGDLSRSPTPTRGCRCSCRPHSDCDAGSRSRSGPNGPIAATGWF
jgi:site-specific recombinase XerC